MFLLQLLLKTCFFGGVGVGSGGFRTCFFCSCCLKHVSFGGVGVGSGGLVVLKHVSFAVVVKTCFFGVFCNCCLKHVSLVVLVLAVVVWWF